MEAKGELLQLLRDTKDWASNPAHFDMDAIYSSWPTHSALLSELDSHHADAGEGLADLRRLYNLYAPTAGLSEIVRTGESSTIYMSLTARFDAWYASVERID